MPSIYKYQKVIDAVTTHTLRMPVDAAHNPLGTELCTTPDGMTYISLPDGATLPTDQPAEITITPVTLSPTLIAEIKAASPHIALINSRVESAIAERYSLAAEIKLLRTAPSPEMVAYNAYAEECRAWGRAEKAKLGL